MAAVESYSPLADEAHRTLDRDPQCLDRERLIASILIGRAYGDQNGN